MVVDGGDTFGVHARSTRWVKLWLSGGETSVSFSTG